MSRRHKKVCKNLDYIDHFLIFLTAVSSCVSISVFNSLVAVLVGITSSAVGLKICEVIAGIKKYKLIIKEKKKKHD